MSGEKKIKSVAIVGAGAAGAITAAALKAENYFERIQVFERRGTPGGTWIYDPDPNPLPVLRPGDLPPDIDPPLEIPSGLPRITPPNRQERYAQTPIYDSLTTNVPDIAMCFSDRRFAYGPFAPHYVPRQYVESYFSAHGTDALLSVNTTVEDISKLAPSSSSTEGSGGGGKGGGGDERWKLTLRKYDSARHVDVWWEEVFDAVVLANGHYSVPYIPPVPGLSTYIAHFPNRVTHSKTYRSPLPYASKRVLIIGNSASGHDLSAELTSQAALPVWQSRRSPSRWDGDSPPPGIAWKPIISEYRPDGTIVFADGTSLGPDDVDAVIYCTGYAPSFPFWNAGANGGEELWDYGTQHLRRGFQHTFVRGEPTLGIVGLPRVLTFRSFEYQAIALARLLAGRNAAPLPSEAEQEQWERARLEATRREGRKFHDIQWETGETAAWLGFLFRVAGLGTLSGEGRIPPALSREVVWAVEHIKKYPEPGKGEGKKGEEEGIKEEGIKEEGIKEEEDGGSESVERRQRGNDEGEWVLVKRAHKDLLGFI
ncbi:putative dimethylaniline monooxygenase [Whalleya microplaca]|nr:putative dimethylaniline monooxygenase [Whalleya microplaca]